MTTRVAAGRATNLGAGDVRVVALAPSASGKPREAIVLRDDAGVVRAYRNLCSHLPVPLDAASRRFVRDGAIQCATHGARYRLDDGYCFAGPCEGTALRALPVEHVGDDLVIVDDGVW